MRLLIDMNLSPAWVQALQAGGFEAIHWSAVGDPRAPDRELLAYAKREGLVVFTNDLDFGAILAATGVSSPSVIQVRAGDLTPARLATIVLRVLAEQAQAIEAGALVTVEPSRSRVRVLPLVPRHETPG